MWDHPLPQAARHELREAQEKMRFQPGIYVSEFCCVQDMCVIRALGHLERLTIFFCKKVWCSQMYKKQNTN